MKYTPFFDTKLSQIALGCDHYGAAIAEKTALAQLDIYYSQGGNLLDTAHIYGQQKEGGPSTSEQVLGKWLRSNKNRKEMVVATKGCHPYKDDMSRGRITYKDMMADIQRSLDQLQSDSVDIWFFHRDDPNMGTDEIIDMGNILVDKALVKHLGVSNWTTKRIEEANTWAKDHNKSEFVISEIQWSLAHCTPETWGDDTLVCMNETERAWYEKHTMPVMAFASQAKGLFSKLIAGKADSLSERARERFLTEVNLAIVPRCKALAEELRVTPAALCMAYLTSQKNPTIAIAGSSKISQITETLGGSDLTLTSEQIAFLR
ncbi:MAG: aldo/keto reductase [Spirochaetia bacterium]|nr:aldo/keto reductase [Spirochaetia bacterium]